MKKIATRSISYLPVSALSLVLAGMANHAVAGKISDSTESQDGWDMGNVTVVYDGVTYQSNVKDGVTGSPVVMGLVLAKDWPLGEAPGIKIVHGDPDVRNGKPANCIMATTYQEDAQLDTPEPQQLLCSGPYQSHKRFKVAMLPTTIDGDRSESIDLVFNVQEEAGSRDYQVFQKINNWTDQRLAGFTISLGTGVGESFEAIVDTSVVSLKVPQKVGKEGLWSYDQVATFSAGLFGAEDEHGQIGYFDNRKRAGFQFAEFGTDAGENGTPQLTANETLKSDYAEVPVGSANQFGEWLPSGMLPQAIFFDDDGNPDTDAELVGWFGYNPKTGATGWMRGVSDNFEAISDAEITAYGQSLLYTTGEIDDLVNVGLNYIVTVGDVAELGQFTIRITPTPGLTTEEPPYYGIPVFPEVTYTSSDGEVSIQSSPFFETSSPLTARVGDSDIFDNTDVIDEVVVSVSAPGMIPVDLPLLEQGDGRGVFAATLPDPFSDVAVGTVVTVTYSDQDDGTGATVEKYATTTAVDTITPILSDSSITAFTVPTQLFDGQSRTVMVTVENDNQALESFAGSLVLEVDGDFEQSFDITIEPGKKTKLSYRWEASLGESDTAETVVWAAKLFIPVDGHPEVLVDSAQAVTDIAVKGGKNVKK
ncbi:MAG: choice-of-anchor F family protein [Halioglobus sp.]